jgi:hypothetical protein
MYKKKTVQPDMYRKVSQDLKNKSTEAYTNYLKRKVQVSCDWGYERLIEIQPIDDQKNMRRLIQMLDDARSKFDDQKILTYSESMIRGFDKFIDYAKFRGFDELSPAMWVVKHPHNDLQIIVVENAEELPKACAMSHKEKPSLYFSIRELLALIDKDVFDIKKRFENSFGNVEIKSRKPITNKDIEGVALQDEIV